MTKKEVKRILVESGFTLKREGDKHELWTNGSVTIPVSRGTKPLCFATMKKFLKRIRLVQLK